MGLRMETYKTLVLQNRVIQIPSRVGARNEDLPGLLEPMRQTEEMLVRNVIAGIEADEASRDEWVAVMTKGAKLLQLTLEPVTPDLLAITRDIARGS